MMAVYLFMENISPNLKVNVGWGEQKKFLTPVRTRFW